MRLTTSNILLGVEPTVSIGGSLDNPLNIVDPDFSTSYTGTNNNVLVFDFGATALINYVAIAGINIASGSNDGSYISVLNGSESGATVVSAPVIRNNCVMITFPAQSFSNLRVVLYSAIGNKLPSARFIAAGTYLELPLGGEGAGYNRQFLNRNNKTKSSLSNLAAPTSVLTKKTAPSGTLTLPNMTKAFSENQWQTFLDFSADNYFFIREQDAIPLDELALKTDATADTSYLCFDVTTTTTSANAQTRELNNLSIRFKVFNGL
jgi:hypothetical protein